VAAAPARAEPRWAGSAFGTELVAALRRSPWFAVSAAVHALLFVVASLFAPPPIARPEAPPTVLVADAATEPMPFGDAAEPLADERGADALPPESVPDLDLPTPPEDAEAPSPAHRANAEPAPVEVSPPDEVAIPPPLIGPAPGTFEARVSRASTKVDVAAKASTSDEPIVDDPERGADMNRRAAARVRGTITRGGGALGRALKGLRREDLLVVKGTFDKMELVLDELRLPYTLATPADVAADELERPRFVFWNCMDPETALPPRSRPAIVAHLRAFVQRGGYLFTTDWGVGNVVMLAFPGTLVTSGSQHTLPELILEVVPKAADHPLLEGVFPASGRVHWWLESASQDVMVVPGSDVEVLVEGPALAAQQRSPIVAATFRYGRGRVLHVMGHYYQQKGHVDGAVAAQRLALNFVRERLERDASGR
jgi:hypothetical protein